MSTSTLPRIDLSLFPPVPLTRKAAPNHQLVNLQSLGFNLTPFGAEEGGYHTEGDIKYVTSDNVDINAMWAEYQEVLSVYNEHRSQLVSLLTFPVQNMVENVPQVGGAEFERASEFGVPKGVRLELQYFSLGYDFKDYDVATRYTWRYLRDADQRAVDAVHGAIIEADNRLVFKEVMTAIFDNRNRLADIKGQQVNVYSLYNADGTVPPPYKSKTFLGTHNHYMTTNGATPTTPVDGQDLLDMYENIHEHGYGTENGSTFVLMVNRTEAQVIRTFRFGVGGSLYDFIPSATEPSLIVPNQQGLIGTQPPSTWNGLQVIGSYANILVIEEDYIPEKYMLMFATGGDANLQNPVGLREHANPQYRGLRLFPGNQTNYPLIDSYYSRSFGTGIRQRAGAVVMQVTDADTYTIPAEYTRG